MGLDRCIKWCTGLAVAVLVLMIAAELARSMWLFLAAMILCAVIAGISFRYWRCPWCGRWLGRCSYRAEFCPYCGKPLEREEPK